MSTSLVDLIATIVVCLVIPVVGYTVVRIVLAAVGVAGRTAAPAAPAADAGAMDELRARLAACEAECARVRELEERVDFAERMLADARRERAAIDRPRTPPAGVR